MRQEIKDRWVNALESGQYRQGFGQLHAVSVDGIEQFCCLGVLSNLAYLDGVVPRRFVDADSLQPGVYVYSRCNMASLPTEVVEWAGLDATNPVVTFGDDLRTLSSLNDHVALPFTEIAIVIKESL